MISSGVGRSPERRRFAIGGVAMYLKLYVAGDAPNSIRARNNLEAIRRDYPQYNIQVEVIDVLREPLRSLADDVLVTPTLIRALPEPACRIIGDLSDRERVLLSLGLGEGHG